MRILEKQRKTIQRKFIKDFRQKNADVHPYSVENLKGKHKFLVNATLETGEVFAKCAILTKVRTHSVFGHYSYEPTIVVSSHTVKKEHRLEMFFVSHVLERVQEKRPVTGRIVGLDGKSHRVKLENGPRTLIPFLEPVQEWVADETPEPPSLILNKNCLTCQFYALCREKAVQEDSLSLLDGISTQKAINRYERKGIFTVKQLSYTFRPRKRRKRAKNPPPVVHKPELQALAIREQKIYLQELPELTSQPVELFLDIEGIPDQQFYYLIGLLVSENDTTAYHPFWADTPDDEAQIWQQFLEKVNQYPDAPIYHYGNYDARALTKLGRRYDIEVEDLIERLVNVNKHIYGKVYFPIYSNRLKEIGGFIGAIWTAPNASGLQSLVWRHYWDETCSIHYKDMLLTYNLDDCKGLKLISDNLLKIVDKAETVSNLALSDQVKRRATKADNPIHYQFESILRFAHSHYDKKKISFRQMVNNEGAKKKSMKRGTYRKKYPRLTKTVQLPRRDTCPTCEEDLKETEITTENTIIDLVHTKRGIRKTVIKYWAVKGRCRICGRTYNPPGFNMHGGPPRYGRGIKVWIVYQRVALKSSYLDIYQVTSDLFDEQICDKLIINYIRDIAKEYLETEKILIQYLLASPFVHVDETDINIQGANWYVWVFTDGKHVLLKLRETRETEFVHDFLEKYDGVVISDFYPGYDSLKTKQQKCWVHLIRDINNDLWDAPNDMEFNQFVLEVKNLIVPILVAVDKYGLKKRNLAKFKKKVDKFYAKNITDKYYKSERVNKYRKRFMKHRESLFTFLDGDGLPWHNNTAEYAIRHIALQRKISRIFSKTVTPDYLRLLSIKQTCRFQDKSFFKFLFSGETDIDKFEARKRRQHS